MKSRLDHPQWNIRISIRKDKGKNAAVRLQEQQCSPEVLFYEPQVDTQCNSLLVLGITAEQRTAVLDIIKELGGFLEMGVDDLLQELRRRAYDTLNMKDE